MNQRKLPWGYILVFLLTLNYSCETLEFSNPILSDNYDKLTQKMAKVPTLLDRNERIQAGKEWENVQNKYVQYRQQIIDNKQAETAKLKMAELFTLEARVTGEHGHYYPAALQLCNEVLEKGDLNTSLKFSTLMNKAGIQLSQHEFSAALETAQKALRLNPHNPQIYGVLTDAYVELGEYKKAVEMADRMVTMRPDLRSYSRISYLREIHGMPEGAIQAMQLAVSSGHPGTEETCWTELQLGYLLMDYVGLNEAELIFQKILDNRPNYSFAISALADLEIRRGNDKKAEDYLKIACQIIPEVGFFEQMAKLKKHRNSVSENNQNLNEILEMLQDDVDSGHNMNLEYAAIYLDLKDEPKKALDFALMEYEKRPKNIDVNLLLAKIYTSMGKESIAKNHLDLAQKTKSKNPELLALSTTLAMK